MQVLHVFSVCVFSVCLCLCVHQACSSSRKNSTNTAAFCPFVLLLCAAGPACVQLRRCFSGAYGAQGSSFCIKQHYNNARIIIPFFFLSCFACDATPACAQHRRCFSGLYSAQGSSFRIKQYYNNARMVTPFCLFFCNATPACAQHRRCFSGLYSAQGSSFRIKQYYNNTRMVTPFCLFFGTVAASRSSTVLKTVLLVSNKTTTTLR